MSFFEVEAAHRPVQALVTAMRHELEGHGSIPNEELNEMVNEAFAGLMAANLALMRVVQDLETRMNSGG